MERSSRPDAQQPARSLGIPENAEQVLIFSESSHWDPNWIHTSEYYFEKYVRHNLDQALEELKKEPRRIYSIECIFFLRMYWDRYPSKREIVRTFINESRLRLTGSGVTTADTLLPSSEAILRDFLIGQEWLRTNGMEQEPDLAYFSDSFGCTPALPSLLNAAGFNRTAITRIDGMYFIGCDYESSQRFPRTGSTAALLLNSERCLDFIWRDRNGAEVLCHWNAYTYGQGDMLAFAGITRIYLARLAVPFRTDRHIARRIRKYVSQLAPYSQTPYMFCPIGFDFAEPIPELVELLDRYNEKYYPTTGVWAVNAGLDDYLSLVETYRDALPVLEPDPNPYWTGFYTARPTLKKKCLDLVDNLLLAEKLSLLAEGREGDNRGSENLEDAWWQAATSNHHDFITGTSPDKIVEKEQLPWIDKAASSVDAVISQLTGAASDIAAAATCTGLPSWSRKNGKIRIETGFYQIELDENAGGAIVSVQSRKSKTPLLAGISNDPVSFKDSGGLWRMGMEFAGGKWKESMRAGSHLSHIEVQERNGGLEFICSTKLNGEMFLRRIWICNESPAIHCRIEGMAAKGYSVVIRFATGIRSKQLVMATPGGVVSRPAKKIYNPTFWPLHNFVHLRDDATGRGLAVIQPLPGAISCKPDGELELVAMRNAMREKAFGLIGIPANPASGHERESYAFEYTLLFTENGDWRENGVHIAAWDIADGMAANPWRDAEYGALQSITTSIVTCDSPNVRIVAIKPASRGEGTIVRLNAPVVPDVPVSIISRQLTVTEAFLCDARERDLEPLQVYDGAVSVTMSGTISSVRLLPGTNMGEGHVNA
jgi:hypothetical protein